MNDDRDCIENEIVYTILANKRCRRRRRKQTNQSIILDYRIVDEENRQSRKELINRFLSVGFDLLLSLSWN